MSVLSKVPTHMAMILISVFFHTVNTRVTESTISILVSQMPTSLSSLHDNDRHHEINRNMPTY